MLGSKNKIIGRSTHSVEQAIEAKRQGADYIGFGPIYKTPTKPTYNAVGLAQIRTVVDEVKIPVVCIGGINRSNIQEVLRAGAGRVAVVRAIFASEDAYEAASELKGLLN